LDAYILAKAVVLLFKRRGVYGNGEQGAWSKEPEVGDQKSGVSGR
jgi:hypothetical protein